MKNLNLKELDKIELISIDAGAPGKDTSFVYDCVYYFMKGFSSLYHGGCGTAMASPVGR